MKGKTGKFKHAYGHKPAKSFASKVKNVLKKTSELKYHGTSKAPTSVVQSQTTVTPLSLLTISQGITDAGNRIGDIIELVDLEMRYFLKQEAVAAAVVSTVNGHMARVIVVQVAENVTPAIGNILKTPDVLSEYNYDYIGPKKTMNVLYDRTHCLCPGGIAAADLQYVHKKIPIRTKKRVQYAAAGTDPIMNDLFLAIFYEDFATANEVAPTYGYEMRVRYLDI